MSEDNKTYAWRFDGYDLSLLGREPQYAVLWWPTKRKWWQFWKPRYFTYHVPVGDKEGEGEQRMTDEAENKARSLSDQNAQAFWLNRMIAEIVNGEAEIVSVDVRHSIKGMDAGEWLLQPETGDLVIHIKKKEPSK